MGFSKWMDAEAWISDQVRNIFCVGRNYRDHASELGNQVPESPMIFGKFTHSLVPAVGEVEYPAGRSDVHHELEIVLWLRETPRRDRPLDAVGGVALGIDLTDRALQSVLKQKGYPWEAAKSFRNSAIVTGLYRFDNFADVEGAHFVLEKNGQVVQEGVPSDMVFSFADLILHCLDVYGLKGGDIVFTGTPSGVGPVLPGDELVLRMNGEAWGSFRMAGKGESP
ncbi:fumarylacetoacetate hydrolase family protein [Alicyclobacillus vulcanalis]|uniref:2-keto-4-pentenoate hydratase/2-oxohepta-3-ene-1,7-dioic acid hydratase (Catechol pathway) n=1 Tax=Alicyclobacillus vulcanalis TaxID=252246 RepID=A0A1N7P8J7_9BACL|nr:fumarylacetoacetate hydrolase family protein [Alicyclobacillus vulcanalis]SIT06857.1 2-keto-4-pentenoate hydratase/2-oxohepta-3-ene-1,7-dioic acid hydratase (catechol pathway) [Alicyclobacillus vulcanalis]